jgi:hypothetical protein
MTRGQGLLLAGLAVAAVAVWALLLGQLLAPEAPPPDGQAVVVTEPPVTPPATPTSSPAPVASESVAPTPTPPPDPTDPPAATEPPAAGGGGRPAFLTFLARMDAARADAQDLNAELREAGEASDEAAVRSTAGEMDDLVERERAWLDANPPDPCYAEAHDAADDLLSAYGSVAAAAIGWADASGLAVLSALADLYDAVETAAAAAADVEPALEAVECPA